MSDDDPIGYKKPPSSSRFRKGVSGNPRGRPKRLKNIATLMKKALHERVSVQENGRRRVITKAEAISKQLINKAAAGDLRALNHLLKLEFLAQEFMIPKKVEKSDLESMSSAELAAMIRTLNPDWHDDDE